MNKKTKTILIIIAAVLGVLAIAIFSYFIFTNLFAEKCEPLTPLALQKFERAGGVKPIEGAKCEISKNSYLLRIIYKNKEDALKAKNSLQIITEGKRQEVGGLDWITNKGDSSVFWAHDEKLGILVAPGLDEEDDIRKELDKAHPLLK